MFCFKYSHVSKFENYFTWKQRTKNNFSGQQWKEFMTDEKLKVRQIHSFSSHLTGKQAFIPKGPSIIIIFTYDNFYHNSLTPSLPPLMIVIIIFIATNRTSNFENFWIWNRTFILCGLTCFTLDKSLGRYDSFKVVLHGSPMMSR